MSTIVKVETPQENKYLVLSKGAPEIVKSLLKTVPEGYDKCFRSYVERGCRVLALAYKDLDRGATHSTIGRDEAEKDL